VGVGGESFRAITRMGEVITACLGHRQPVGHNTGPGRTWIIKCYEEDILSMGEWRGV
jgi:hypothetical protein